MYFHRNIETNNIFYIGKGIRERRPYEFSGRSKSWETAASTPFSVEIVQENLTNKEAVDLENKLLHEFKDNRFLVNKFKTSSLPLELSLDLFKEWFYYSETSPSLLRWKKTSKNHKEKINLPAGFLSGQNRNRFSVSLLGKTYFIHRILYLFYHGSISSDKDIDHIDGNPMNNSKDNLREVSRHINNKNRPTITQNLRCIESVNLSGNLRQGYLIRWSDEDGRYSRYFGKTRKRTLEQALEQATAFRDSLITQGLILTRKT